MGRSLTAEQAAAIKAGTFEDIYLGDYWQIDGVDYIVAGFDYWYQCGDTACTTHHVVIIPRNHLYTYHMNASNTTEGGYVGSDMYKNGLTQAKATFNAAFGSAHILNHREHQTKQLDQHSPVAVGQIAGIRRHNAHGHQRGACNCSGASHGAGVRPVAGLIG